jgi:hypothetical protein
MRPKLYTGKVLQAYIVSLAIFITHKRGIFTGLFHTDLYVMYTLGLIRKHSNWSSTRLQKVKRIYAMQALRLRSGSETKMRLRASLF